MKIKVWGIKRVVTKFSLKGGKIELRPKLRKSWSCKEHQKSILGRKWSLCKKPEFDFFENLRRKNHSISVRTRIVYKIT